MIAAIYARYSTDRQRQASIVDQNRNCTDLINEKGWVLNHDCVRSDEGLSGASLHTREALLSLIEDAKREPPPFDVLVIDDTARLGRDLADVLNVSKALVYAGIALYFVTQELDSRSPSFFQSHVMYGMADQELLKKIAFGAHRGMKGRILEGMSAGGRCFGYRSVRVEDLTKSSDGQPALLGFLPEIYEPEAVVVRRIFDLSAEGLSLLRIAKRCDEEGLLLPRPRLNAPHTQWTRSIIQSILHNKRYLGEVTWNKTKAYKDPSTGRTVTKRRPETQWVFSHVPERRIVSDEQWEKAHETIKRANETMGWRKLGGLGRAKAPQDYIFSGQLYCGLCGGPMVISGGGGGGGGGSSRYACRNHRFRSKENPCQNSLGIPRSVLEDELVAEIVRRLSEPEMMDHAIVEFQTRLKGDFALHFEANARALKETPKLKKELIQLKIRANNYGKVIGDEGPNAPKTLVSLLAQTDNQIKAIEDLLNVPKVRSIPLDRIRDFVQGRAKHLAEVLLGDRTAAKQAIRTHVGKLKLTPKKVRNGRRGNVYVIERMENQVGGHLVSSADIAMLLGTGPGTSQHYTELVIPTSLPFVVIPTSPRPKRIDYKRVDYLARPKCPAAVVVQRWQAGQTFEQIGRELNVSRQVVSKVFSAVQASKTSCGSALTRPKPSRPKAVRQLPCMDYLVHPKCPASEVVRLRGEGKTFQEIGRVFGVSDQIPMRVFHAVYPDISLEKGTRRVDHLAHPKCPASEVVRLRGEGSTFDEIGRTFGVSGVLASTVFYAVQPNSQKRGKRRIDYRTHPKCPASEVVQLRAEGKTFAELARLLGVSKPVVLKVFHAA